MLAAGIHALFGLLIVKHALACSRGFDCAEDDLDYDLEPLVGDDDLEYDDDDDYLDEFDDDDEDYDIRFRRGNLTDDSRRVLYGRNAGEGAYPWLVQLWATPDQYQCVGSIIHSGYILTCAHCVASFNPSTYKVIAGTVHLNGNDGYRVNVRGWTIHPGYDGQHVNDIAVIQLDSYLPNTPKIRIVQISEYPYHPPGLVVNFAGWGRTETGQPAQVLQEISFRVIDTQQCEDWWGGGILCCNNVCTTTLRGPPGACFGDSGTPIVYQNYLIAMFHKLEYICGTGRPDVHYDIPLYKNWIKSLIGKIAKPRLPEVSREVRAVSANLGSYRKVRVVLGNPTCDLDSAVCALAQGLLEYSTEQKKNRRDIAVIPVMNIPRKEFRLKTEVVYYLKRHALPPDLLTFRDQIELAGLCGRLELILVDHHSLADEDRSLADSVVQVIDHRPQDVSWPWRDRSVHLQLVGSCATLVARNIMRTLPEIIDAQLCSLLRGPILVDTSNFSREADRATPLDAEVINDLEKLGSLEPTSRDDVFKEIVAAKTDIAELTAEDLLIKDLKVANGVPLVGFPLLVEDFLSMKGALEAVVSFSKSRMCGLAVLLGLNHRNGQLARDIAVFSLSSNELENKIIQALTSSTQPSLDLTLARRVQEEGCNLHHYRQGNLRATRKQILPIVQGAASAVRDGEKDYFSSSRVN